MELDQYLGLFIDESRENLQKLNESLLKLETNSEDLEILNDVFRVAHTLKGMSRTMGFNSIGDLTHNMENVLEPLRSGSIKADSKVLDVLFKCLDSLEKLVEKVYARNYDDKNEQISGLVEDLQGILLNKADVTLNKKSGVVEFNQYEQAIFGNAISNGFNIKEITVIISSDSVLPGVRAYMVSTALENHGELIKTVPNVEEIETGVFIEDGKGRKAFKLFYATQSTNEILADIIKEISEIDDVQISDFTEKDMNQQGETSQIEPADGQSEEKDTNEGSSVVNAIAKVVPQTIRVSASKLDKLMNLVGELVINKTRITQISNEQKLNEMGMAIGHMETITSEIQEIVMKLRMVSIEQVFNRFPRLVRDISKDLKKDVNLVITGKDTEIDRIVVDEIGDPLVHLIRNSLDHGLENPEDRIMAGKSAKGTLELSALNEGDNILIRVIDDGKGIDPEHVKAVAVKKGIIDAETAKALHDKDALDLIFAPGFSTTETATDLSGRGVGMDVVKSKTAALGGSVSVNSQIGKGTAITITFPSKMAIVPSLLIKVGSETYATPLNYISEVIDIHPKQVRNIQENEVIVLREKTLPLVRLHQMLEVPGYEPDPDSPLTVVVVKTQDKYAGVVVSELIGQQEVVIKPINKYLCSEEYFSGATTLGDGNVALILNVNSLLRKNYRG